MTKLKIRRPGAFLLIVALLAGMLPLGSLGISAAESTDEDHGLSNPTRDQEGVVTWDCVWFGNYWQNDTNMDGTADKNDRKEPVKWRVLSVNGDDAFLLADKNLDRQRYNDVVKAYMTWRECTLRSWLNAYGAGENASNKDYSDDNFIGNAFTEEEQSAIKTTKVVNKSNPLSGGASGGSDTEDKVYLLSIEEAKEHAYGFDDSMSSEGRKVGNTTYVSEGTVYGWWLRSPGLQSNYAADVRCDGANNGYSDWKGFLVNRTDRAVRPVLHLDLSQTSVWQYAGRVTSNDSLTPLPSSPAPVSSSNPPELPTASPVTPVVSGLPTGSPSVSQTPGQTNQPVPTISPVPVSSGSPSEPPVISPAAPSVSETPVVSPVISSAPIVTEPAVSQRPQPMVTSEPTYPPEMPASKPTLPPDLTKDEQTAADQFVDQHVKDPGGKIITEVTDLTRDILVAGEKDWKKLSGNSQKAVDVRLSEAGSRYTYERLLKLAKAYKIPGFKIIKFMKKNSKAKLKLIKCKGTQIVCVSSNKKVATINKKGVIHAKKPGRAKITFAAVKGIYTNRLVIDVRVKKNFKNAKELTNFKSKIIRTPTVLVAKKRLLKQSSRIDVYDLRKSSKVSYEPIQNQILTVNKKGKYIGKKRGSTLVRVTIHQNDKDYLLYLYVTIH